MKTRFLFPAILLLAACNFSGQMKSMFSLSEKINKKYNCSARIEVDNYGKIEVYIEDSPYCDSSDAVQQRICDDIGQMALAQKELGEQLEEGYMILTCGNEKKEARFTMHLHKN